MWYIGLIIVSFFLSQYFGLLHGKSEIRDIMQNIWEKSLYSSNEDFGNYYMANAGIYYAAYFEPHKYSKKVGLMSLYGFLSLIIAAIYAFTYNIINIVTIEGIITTALIFLTDTVRFYSFNLSDDLLFQSLTDNYLRYSNKKLVQKATILEFHNIASNITQCEFSKVYNHIQGLKL